MRTCKRLPALSRFGLLQSGRPVKGIVHLLASGKCAGRLQSCRTFAPSTLVIGKARLMVPRSLIHRLLPAGLKRVTVGCAGGGCYSRRTLELLFFRTRKRSLTRCIRLVAAVFLVLRSYVGRPLIKWRVLLCCFESSAGRQRRVIWI